MISRVRCNLCAHRCVIPPGKQGACCVRENRDGTLVTLVYERAISQHIDPIEKKPLFHFLPGSRSLLHRHRRLQLPLCLLPELGDLPVAARSRRTVREIPGSCAAGRHRTGGAGHGCASIAYTYTEPTIFAEYALDTAARRSAWD